MRLLKQILVIQILDNVFNNRFVDLSSLDIVNCYVFPDINVFDTFHKQYKSMANIKKSIVKIMYVSFQQQNVPLSAHRMAVKTATFLRGSIGCVQFNEERSLQEQPSRTDGSNTSTCLQAHKQKQLALLSGPIHVDEKYIGLSKFQGCFPI